MFELAKTAAQYTDVNVLVTGESGTGKEIIARIIHYMGPHSDNYFGAINCSSITESLMESEFFGHKKGAFTGAVCDKKGLFELCNEGTLFLDEIADMPYVLQSKILRAIEEKVITRVGDTKLISTIFRVISATNVELDSLVEEKKFRLDLLHRLNTLYIHIPPLRDRTEDIAPLLIDYLVCLLSTERSPGLNGQPGNGDRLRRDLADMGVFDEQMSVYLLYKQRECAKMGFSGFEGRHYSLFENFGDDMGRATDVQTLITALAYKYMAHGTTHSHIPDTPSLESERRQIFFGAAIGLPTFFVRRNNSNSFLENILKKTDGIRPSHRYPGYLRVQIHEYRRALIKVIREDGADLIELMGLHDTLNDLELRLNEPAAHSAAGRLTSGILAQVNASSPLRVNARDFNVGAESYYRTTLRQRHIKEACGFLMEDCRAFDREPLVMDELQRTALRGILQGQDAARFVENATEDVLHERADITTLQRLMNLIVLKVYQDQAPAV